MVSLRHRSQLSVPSFISARLLCEFLPSFSSKYARGWGCDESLAWMTPALWCLHENQVFLTFLLRYMKISMKSFSARTKNLFPAPEDHTDENLCLRTCPHWWGETPTVAGEVFQDLLIPGVSYVSRKMTWKCFFCVFSQREQKKEGHDHGLGFPGLHPGCDTGDPPWLAGWFLLWLIVLFWICWTSMLCYPHYHSIQLLTYRRLLISKTRVPNIW